ncbi:MAG: hypothetical protein J2P32_08185 [Actinobacteria bacterium]|nr:hypothetical protein [Actinomycetota bacterium]
MRQLKSVGGDAGAIEHDLLKVAGAMSGNGNISSAAGTLAADGGLLNSDARTATLNPPPACADRADFLASMSDYQSAGSDMQTAATAVESSDYATADAQLVAGNKALVRGTRHLSDAKAAIDRVNGTAGSSGLATASGSPPATPRAAKRHRAARSPVATVRAYFKAINNQDYARAWHLGGRYTGSSYSEFVSGFQDTAHDIVTILSVSGNVVTARLSARQTDGSVRTYQGTYRVSHGVITQFQVAQVGSSSGSSGSSSGCSPKAPSGNCYEPGEYCPEADAHMTGVAGDGKTITCEKVSGRYHWEH